MIIHVKQEYIPNDPKAVCDRCGGTYRMSELRMEWTGLLVCKYDFNPKHPQLDLRVPVENQAVPNARPRGEFRFVSQFDSEGGGL